MLFKIVLPAEAQGHAQGWALTRRSLAFLLNSGTAWAGLSVYAGWAMRRIWPAFLAGVIARAGTLLVHYLSGIAGGLYPWQILETKLYWFAIAGLLCGLLGAVGWAASHRKGALGLAATLLVPLGAVAEPFLFLLLMVACRRWHTTLE